VRDDLKPIPGFHLLHTETELEDELPAADLTRVPVFFQELPFRTDRTPCLGGARYFPVGPFPPKAASHHHLDRFARVRGVLPRPS
jgi:hypothetical protein